MKKTKTPPLETNQSQWSKYNCRVSEKVTGFNNPTIITTWSPWNENRFLLHSPLSTRNIPFKTLLDITSRLDTK